VTPGTCRFCGCQEADPCEGGCAWTDETRTLCTACVPAEAFIRDFIPILGAVERNAKAPVRVVIDRWDALTLKSQRVLVMVTRAMMDVLRDALLDDITDETIRAGAELNAISGYLMEHCRDEMRPGDTLSGLVIRLLEPHVGNRIVLPGGR